MEKKSLSHNAPRIKPQEPAQKLCMEGFQGFHENETVGGT